ncbi:hypothetical protein QWY16_07550 [Planococcus shenhongbingii]|uniref:hypothetical protein n=1 Tax=Planococcus shenhongbingii TaxID=3058398 RepID=UPI00263319AF|nr:hypothetical protein [Planococcus sp. N016]WKA59952.1 hypothetical protein QWY16_07550 [Planococcus sp. N016]
MEFTLLDNGQDSLKKAKYNIEKYEELVREHSYPYLKDSIIFLNHGIEMLLKYILTNRNEFLIFSDVELYLAAKKALKELPKSKGEFGFRLEKEKTIFDVPKKKLNGKNLFTITLLEALDRVEYVCDVDIKPEVKSSINLINKYRNSLTHHSINLTDEEEDHLISVLKTLFNNVINFFEEHIPGRMATIHAEKFEITNEEWIEMQEAIEESYDEFLRDQQEWERNRF